MTTRIEWTEMTWNPVSGCTRVSPGCDHCYIERTVPFRIDGRRFDGDGPRSTTGVALHPERLDQPLHWRKPRRVFVNSMSDLFHEEVPAEHIARVFAVMAMTPRHSYQVLTKRHARMRALLNRAEFWREVRASVTRDLDRIPEAVGLVRNPLLNVWLGVSVETQQWADIRVPALLETPAAVRFLSCEPLLGPVDLDGPPDATGHRAHLTYWLTGRPHFTADGTLTVGPRIDWVIVGGESGPGARPMHPDWARSLRDQCTAAGVPYFMKQWGEWAPDGHFAGDPRVLDDRQHAFPGSPDPRFTHTVVRRVGKKAAGRELDGREWDQYPQAVTA